MSSIYDWSYTDPSQNQSADGDIDWREGQSPASVNDSARMMMTRISQYIKDLSGNLLLMGNGQGYRGLCSVPFDKQTESISFRAQFSADCEYSPVLAVNNFKTAPMIKQTLDSFTVLEKNDIRTGLIYFLTCGIDKPGFKGLSWIVHGLPVRPVGQISAFGGTKIPKGWLLCDGHEEKKSDYPALFSAIGSNWGAASNENNFKLPDLRGQFLRGLDSTGKIDSQKERIFASRQDDSLKSHAHDMQRAGLHRHEFHGTTPNKIWTPVLAVHDKWNGDPTVQLRFNKALHGQTDINYYNSRFVAGTGFGLNDNFELSKEGEHNHTINNSGDLETRPKNVAVNFYIKY